jgi:hypothetical protein
MDYCDINCCNKTRNIDTALKHYQKDRQKVLANLIKEPERLISKLWVSGGYLSNDKECMTNCGAHRKYTSFICAPCKNMSRIVDLDENPINRPFTIECGQEVGNSFIITKHDIGEPFMEVSKEDKIKGLRFLSNHRDMLTCGSQDIKDLTLFKSDTFTNHLLNWWIVNYIFEKEKLPFHLRLHTSYICRGKGMMLSDAPTLGNLDRVLEKHHNNHHQVILSVFKQVTIILDILSDNFFSHGMPHIDMVVFSEEEIEEDYKGVHIYSSFIAHLIDFSYSSITYRNTRIYPASDRSNVVINYADLNIKIANGKFTIANESYVLFDYVRHAGLPIYSSSFDFYCIITSMMLKSAVRNMVLSTDLVNHWKALWEPDQYEKISKLISKYQDIDVDVVKLLSGFWLRCDVVAFWRKRFAEK